MADVLNQADIDALLQSVQTEEISQPAPSPPATPSFASQGGPTDDFPALEPYNIAVEAHTYDFKRPERVSKDQIRSLGSIHEVFARNAGATLSNMLRTIIDVKVVEVEQLTYSEFIHSLPNPTCFMVLKAPPLEGEMCMELSPLIVYPLMDRMLGGNSSELYIPQRPLTSIEWRLMERIAERLLEHLSEVWHNLVDAHFEISHTESNPQLIHIVAPTEVVVFVTFEIKFGQFAGTMSLSIPFNTIEAVMGHLGSQAWFYKPKPANEVQLKRLNRSLTRGEIALTAFLGRTTIKLSELRTLRSGDLLPIDKRANASLVVQVGGRNKFTALPGQLRGRKAIRLIGAADPDDPL